jgi:Flp pilus assembly pilin Flp
MKTAIAYAFVALVMIGAGASYAAPLAHAVNGVFSSVSAALVR